MTEILTQFNKLLQIRKLWLYLYLFKATLAFLMILPFYMTYNSIMASSLYSKTLSGNWDLSVITELIAHTDSSIPSLLMVLLIGGIIYVIGMQFINGGLYYLIISRDFERIDWRMFFAECGMNFGTHVKITFIMMIVYSLLIPASMFLVNLIGVAGESIIGWTAAIFTLFKISLILLILTVASIYSDSVRAASASYPNKTFREIIKVGSEFYKPRLWKLLGIFIITYIPFLIIWLIAEWSALKSVSVLPASIGIFAEFMIFQVVSAARTGQKLWYLAVFGLKFKSDYPGRFVPKQAELNLDG